MEKDYLIIKRASASRPSGEWNDDDYDVLANGEVVGRIFKADAAPVGSPWDVDAENNTKIPRQRTAMPRAGEGAMAAFAKNCISRDDGLCRFHDRNSRKCTVSPRTIEVLTELIRSAKSVSVLCGGRTGEIIASWLAVFFSPWRDGVVRLLSPKSSRQSTVAL